MPLTFLQHSVSVQESAISNFGLEQIIPRCKSHLRSLTRSVSATDTMRCPILGPKIAVPANGSVATCRTANVCCTLVCK